MGYYGFAPYVPVAERRRKALRYVEKLKKQGKKIFPLGDVKMKIAHSFWGKAWCEHVESLGDFANRLPRGKTYVRNGSVCHLDVSKGHIEAIVAGSEVYKVQIDIAPLSAEKWSNIKSYCTGKISSMIDLLSGSLSDGVMQEVCNKHNGLFPLSSEIQLSCSCPDWATMCKHVAAVLYGVGVRLDAAPQQLFLLRGVDHHELIDVSAAVLDITSQRNSPRKYIADNALSDVFGVDVSKPKPPTVKQTKNAKPLSKPKPKPKAEAKQSAPRPERVLVLNPKHKKIKAKKAPGKTAPRYFSGVMIRNKRLQKGLTQAEFAKQVGVSPATVSRWESFSRQKVLLQVQAKEKLLKIWQ